MSLLLLYNYSLVVDRQAETAGRPWEKYAIECSIAPKFLGRKPQFNSKPQLMPNLNPLVRVPHLMAPNCTIRYVCLSVTIACKTLKRKGEKKKRERSPRVFSLSLSLSLPTVLMVINWNWASWFVKLHFFKLATLPSISCQLLLRQLIPWKINQIFLFNQST